MKYVIDANEMFEDILAKPENERGKYIEIVSYKLYQGIIDAPWIAPMPKTTAGKIKLAGGYSDSFELFWAEYPRKENKANAYKVWQSIVKAMAQMKQTEQQLLNSCLTALIWQSKLPDWTKDNGKWIPSAEKYLNNQRWQDLPPKAATKPRVLTMDGTWI